MGTRWKHSAKKKKPRMIIYNVPDEITMDNAADIIREQNPELTLKTADITKNSLLKTRGTQETS